MTANYILPFPCYCGFTNGLVMSLPMKKLIQLFSLATLAGMAITAQGQTWLTKGLVAYYPFNGSADDSAGTNNGTVTGATLTADRLGHLNTAFSFNGINNRIDFNKSPLTNVANWTISAWIKPANFTQQSVAVQVGFDNAGTGNGYGIGFVGYLYSSNLVGILSGVDPGWIDSGRASPSTNQWQHIVMLRDATTTKFFIDGLQTPSTYTTTPKTPTDFTIGSQNGLRFFNGLIDDVRIYNRALSSNEVSQLHSIEAGYLTIHKAVYLDSGMLSVGTNYQLQVSSDLLNWTNQGAPFTATDSYWRPTNYWDVENWGTLFFRLKPQ